MDKQPAPRSRKIWWVLGGIAFVAVVAVAASGSAVPTPAASNTPAVQTANISEQVAQPAVQPQVQPQAQPQPQQNSLSNNNTYVNSDGNVVHSPAYSNDGVPAGATAQCRDGTYSFSQHRSGTCSGHMGVATWLN